MRYAISILGLVMMVMSGSVMSADFAQPRPGLHTGGVPSAEQLDRFQARGVRTVIDLRHPDELKNDAVAVEATARGMRYVKLPINGADGLTRENAERLRSALDAADGEVLLHCASGNRVGALLALMAHFEEGVPRRQALELGRRAGLKALEPEVDARMTRSWRSR